MLWGERSTIAELTSLTIPKPHLPWSRERGTSVNSIAAEARMLMDMRFNRLKELLELENMFLEIVRKVADEENARGKRQAHGADQSGW